MGIRKFIKNGKKKTLHVPQCKSTIHFDLISVDDNLKRADLWNMFISGNEEREKYFPIQKEMVKLPREWLLNMIYSVVGEDFKKHVHECMDARNEKIIDKKNLGIELDPEIMKAFQNSTHVSTQKGSSASMIKIGSKRRRT